MKEAFIPLLALLFLVSVVAAVFAAWVVAGFFFPETGWERVLLAVGFIVLLSDSGGSSD